MQETQETQFQSLGQEGPLEEEMATSFSILVLPWWLRWERICLQCGRPGFDPWVGMIPWEEEMATCSSILALKNPMDRGDSWGTVHRVTKSWTRLSDWAQYTYTYIYNRVTLLYV